MNRVNLNETQEELKSLRRRVAELEGLVAKLKEYIAGEWDSRLHGILSALADSVFVLDKEGRFTEFYISGNEPYVPPEKLISKKYEEAMPAYVNRLFTKAFNNNKRGELAGYEYPLEKNGKQRWYSAKLSPLFREGNFEGAVAVVRDITKRKELQEEIIQARADEEALRVSEKMKTQLLSLVSHELHTPLASIKGFASTLLQPDVKWTEEEEMSFITEIDRAADRLSRLVADLLDVTYIQFGTLKLSLGSYNLNRVLQSASDTLFRITEHHLLQLVIPDDLPSVYIDEMRIIQVLANLVENAVKFSEKGSRIRTEAVQAKNRVVVTVSDEGIGIPAELLDKIFDRFYQAEHIVPSARKGTGLGLSICKGIIAAHGGKIWVESKEGEGSKFSFSLPIAK
jgi:PAS domain S-box-containing protein